MTNIDSNHSEFFDNEYSNQYNSDYSQCGLWMIDDYDSNWRKYRTPSNISYSAAQQSQQ